MRVPLSWLHDYVQLPNVDPSELAHTLELLGHEVEEVEHVDVGWTGVIIAHVKTVEAHPNADKVRVCTVTTGGDPITVVCGAWNFEAGANVAFAVPGAVLPGGFEIGVRTIRGVESHGMICSEKELGIGDDAAGILVLDPGVEIGQPLESILPLPDVIFDLSITPNRPDAMSMVGIARDLAAWYGKSAVAPAPAAATVPGDLGIDIEIQDALGNPRFVARRVDDVTVRSSPLWMRMRLRASGVRPISNLVDVTNYVMLELGQPLHAFDADKIAGDQLTVRRARVGEEIVTLDGETRALTPDDLVIYDKEGPTSLAGTMGGLRSEVSDTTSSVLIEAAAWHPPTIMTMSRRHGLRSEASARFERGVDPDLPPLASLRAAELVVSTAGGQLREGWTDLVVRSQPSVTLQLTVNDVTRLLGERFSSEDISGHLTGLGFGVVGDDPMTVTVPTFRPDVTRPVDLVEEVARLSNYESFGERLRLGGGGGLTPRQRRVRQLREVLASLGCSQAVALSFVMPSEIDAFDAPPDHELRQTILVSNPLSDEEAVLRPTVLPGLLRALRHNRNRGQTSVALFEEGAVFHAKPWSKDRRVPAQPTRLGIAAVGVVGPQDLAGRGQQADFDWIAAVIRQVSERLGLAIRLEGGQHPGFHPTRTAQVVAGSEVIGHAGELHPLTAAAFGLEGRVAAAEIDLDELVDSHEEPSYLPVSQYPPTDFDLSFDLADDVAADSLVAAVRSGGPEFVESIRVFDEFRGGGLEAGRKALAVRVRLRAPDRTLEAADISHIRQAMVVSAGGIGAHLRGSQ